MLEVTSQMSDCITELKKQLPHCITLTDKADLIPYGFDGTAAIYEDAGCVVFPESTQDVCKIVGIAARLRVPIVSRGSGTGLSGGSVPVEGGIILCLAKMNRIIELDRANLTLRAQAGAITQKISQAVEDVGLFYPPDPSSMKIATIGGNVANNSGGLRGLKYGVTRDYVMAMDVVLADGSLCKLGTACVKDVAGYSLKELFIGSEGTLGIITEVLLKLIPKPQHRETVLAVFDSLENAAQCVSDIIAHPITPCTLEFLDNTTIRCVEEYAKIGLPTNAEAMLLMESDGHPAVVEQEICAMEDIAKKSGASKVERARDEKHRQELSSARRTAFSALARVRPTTILEDVTVPRSKLADIVHFIQNIANRYQLKVGTFGHFGDGNVHPTFLTDEKNSEEMHRVEQAMSEIFQYTISIGGTITGEHGVGLAKKNYLPKQFGNSSYNLLKKVKSAIDPQGLLNPGKIFD